MTQRFGKHVKTDDQQTGMPGVTQGMLMPDYWLPETMTDENSIGSSNRSETNLTRSVPVCAGLNDLASVCESLRAGSPPKFNSEVLLETAVPDSSTGLEVFPPELKIALTREAFRHAPAAGQFYDDFGQPFDSTLCHFLKTNAHIDLSKLQPRPGFTVRRADIRTWPTETKAFLSPADRELDRFQETKLHTFEALLVLSQSEDQLWYFIISQTYIGWARQTDVALSTWKNFDTYVNWTNQVVISASGITTQAHPYDPSVSLQPIEFGAYLPLATQHSHILGEQSPVGNVAVLWPVRTKDGLLAVHTAFIPQRPGVQTGFSPCNRKSVLQSAFRLLFERYGWGDLFYNHDCSSYVMDVYRTIGIQLPRNTGQQERCLPFRMDIPATATLGERQQVLQKAKPGDLLFMPGHVMLYLGEREGRYYVLHDFAGYTEQRDDKWVHVPINEVMVSPLDLLTSDRSPYLKALTSLASPLSTPWRPGS